MADSVRERIVKHIQTTLQGITVGNGYSNTLMAVERTLQRGQSFQPPMAYVIEGSDDVIDEAPLGFLSRQLTVGIVLVVQQDEDVDARSASEVMNSLIADIQKAMQQDERRSDLATLTKEIGTSEVDQREGEPVLLSTVAYRVDYRHSRLDPTVAG